MLRTYGLPSPGTQSLSLARTAKNLDGFFAHPLHNVIPRLLSPDLTQVSNLKFHQIPFELPARYRTLPARMRVLCDWVRRFHHHDQRHTLAQRLQLPAGFQSQKSVRAPSSDRLKAMRSALLDAPDKRLAYVFEFSAVAQLCDQRRLQTDRMQFEFRRERFDHCVECGIAT